MRLGVFTPALTSPKSCRVAADLEWKPPDWGFAFRPSALIFGHLAFVVVAFVERLLSGPTLRRLDTRSSGVEMSSPILRSTRSQSLLSKEQQRRLEEERIPVRPGLTLRQQIELQHLQQLVPWSTQQPNINPSEASAQGKQAAALAAASVAGSVSSGESQGPSQWEVCVKRLSESGRRRWPLHASAVDSGERGREGAVSARCLCRGLPKNQAQQQLARLSRGEAS